MKKTVLTAALLGLVTFAQAKTVFSPEQGVICDRKASFCVDRQGISMSFTQMYLGDKAVRAFEKRIAGFHDYDMTRFTLANGLSCDTNKKICKKSKWDDNADPHWTKVLFGNNNGMKHKASGGGHGTASFDCRKARTRIEHAICDNAELSRLDGKMGRLNRQIKSKQWHDTHRKMVKMRNEQAENYRDPTKYLIQWTKDEIKEMERQLRLGS